MKWVLLVMWLHGCCAVSSNSYIYDNEIDCNKAITRFHEKHPDGHAECESIDASQKTQNPEKDWEK